jgi:hypothetical protein
MTTSPTARHRHHARIDQIPRKHADFEAIRQIEPGEALVGRLELLRLEHVTHDLDICALRVLQLPWRGR